jgi:O-antigen ligase
LSSDLPVLVNPPVLPLRPQDLPASPWIAALLGALTVSNFLSTAATNIGALLVSIVALGYWVRFRPFALLRHPLALSCLAFLAWLLVRELLAGEPIATALRSTNNFRPLLYIVLWAPLFAPHLHRRAVLQTFCACLLVFAVMAITTTLATGHPFYRTPTWPVPELGLPQPIAAVHKALFIRAPDLSGAFLVATIFATLQLAWSRERRRFAPVALALLLLVTLLMATTRRTSYVGFVLCSLLIVCLNVHRIDFKTSLRMVLALVASVGLVMATPTARDGVMRIVNDTREFARTPPAQQGYLVSSSGERMRFWEVAGNVALESPLIGVGIAKYPERYVAHDLAMGGSHSQHANPHNELLYLLSTVGLVGLALYLAIQAAVLWSVRRLGHPLQTRIAAYLMLSVVSSLFFNSMIVDMIPGHFYALAVLCVAWFAWPRSRSIPHGR